MRHGKVVDVSDNAVAQDKAVALISYPLRSSTQSGQRKHPDSRIVIGGLELQGEPLSMYADTYEGLHTGDYPRFGRYFWELPHITGGWVLQQAAPATRVPWGGRENVLFWEDGKGEIAEICQKTSTVGCDHTVDQRTQCVGQ